MNLELNVLMWEDVADNGAGPSFIHFVGLFPINVAKNIQKYLILHCSTFNPVDIMIAGIILDLESGFD